ncbi:uncharacterized protein [Primulina eburnea]|uniref:uncharacterized protein n=1 Tax=Primulina eburnea TaxID=1245227 RepID=UPI003C6C0171
MTQFFAQFAGSQAAVNSGARPRPEAVYERFHRMNPKEISGSTDPMVAEGWIKSIEVIFDFMELQDADRVRCAIFLLPGDARRWWESASVAINLPTLSWTGFKEAFFAKYFTEEGDSSVADFVRKFERGCYFVPNIANDAQIAVSRSLAAEQDLRDIEADRQGKRPYQAPPQHP